MKATTLLWSRFAAALLVSSVLWFAGCGNQDAELAAQRQKELETVRAELEQAKSAVAAQEAELTRLRKDNLEVLQLRNKVRQLGDEKKVVEKQAQSAQTQAQQAQVQVQAAQTQAQQAAQALAAQAQAGHANACINQLRQIEGAMQQWALENKKDANAVPTIKDLAAYLPGGVMPKCPAGGGYMLSAVNTAPRCSIAGHALPTQ